MTHVKQFRITSRWALVAHDCGYPLSRYTCRATRVAADFLDFIAFCRCSTGVALHPLKIWCRTSPPLCQEVSHRNLGLKRCRATRGCRSYSCGCRARPGTSVETARMSKGLKESAKGAVGPLGESTKTICCTVRNPVLGSFPWCETGLHGARDSFGTLGTETPNHF